MKSIFLIISIFLSFNVFANSLPNTVVCVKNDDSRNSVLIMNLSANEGVVPNYDLSYIVNGKVYLSFQTSLKNSDSKRFDVEGYINVRNRSDVIGYAGFDLASGVGYYMEAANNGASPLPSTSFPSCKVFN